MTRRYHPGNADPRHRDPAAIKRSQERAAFVQARIDSHGADGLNDWLRDNGVMGWGTLDAGSALAEIRKRLGVDVWRAALDVVGIT
jgi:hypothetical protein